MKKFFITIVLFLLATATYFYLDYRKNKATISVESLVPEDAFLFYQTDDFFTELEKIDSSNIGLFLNSFNTIESKKRNLESILTLVPKDKIDFKFSAHKTSKGGFDLVYYFSDNQSNVIGLIDVLMKKNKWRLSKRKLDKININEYTLDGKSVLNYFEKGGVLVVSANPFLIEESIKNKYSFEEFPINKWVVFPSNLNQLISDFIIDKTLIESIDLKGNRIVFDLDLSDNQTRLIGVSNNILENKDDKLNNVKLSDIHNYITISSIIIRHNANSFELSNSKNENLKIISTGDIVFNDTLFSNYSQYLLKNENGKFYSKIDDKYTIESESKESIVNYLNDVENEDVWGKSLKLESQLDKVVEDASLSLLLSKSGVNDVVRNLNSMQKKELGSSIRLFDNINFVSFQKSSNQDNDIYEWFLEFKNQDNLVAAKVEENKVLEFKNLYSHDVAIRTKPYLVRNHNTSDREIILQDSLNNLCLIDLKGNLLWKKSLESKIKSDIEQVDLFRNGKLQYAFTTKNKFYIVDRNGDDVEKFPISLENEIEYLSVFDYDNDKRYRFLVTLIDGSCIMFDGNGDKLAPWNPFKIGSPIVSKPMHFRVGTKDVILVSSINKVHLLNRRAEYLDNFPFVVNIPQIDVISFDKGKNFKSSSIEIFDEFGNFDLVNLNAEIIKSDKYKNKIVGKRQFFFSNGDFVNLVKEDYSYKIYTSKGDELIELFDEVEDLQYYDFGNQKNIVFAKLRNGNINIIDKNNIIGEFSGNLNLSCLYSQSKEELSVFYTYKNEVRNIKQ